MNAGPEDPMTDEATNDPVDPMTDEATNDPVDPNTDRFAWKPEDVEVQHADDPHFHDDDDDYMDV